MKKIFTLLVALAAFSAVFAQHNKSYDYPTNNRNESANSNYYNGNENHYGYPNHAVVITGNGYQRDNNYRDDERRAEIERINRDYDRRINDYRNNRRLNAYERNRQIRMIEKERSDKLKAFGGGVLLGGIIGVILGSHL